MNITIKNGVLSSGSDPAIRDTDHTVFLDAQTMDNVKEKLDSECWLLIGNCFSTYCGIDEAPCNGVKLTCHLLEKRIDAAGMGGATDGAVNE
jgi:hypothetical protein